MSAEVKSDGGGSEEEAVRSEDELGMKWDRCVADTIIKTGEEGGKGGSPDTPHLVMVIQ